MNTKETTNKKRTEHGDNDRNFDYFTKYEVPSSSPILDIGCNLGSFVYKLHDTGWTNAYGIDINEAGITQGKDELPEIASYISLFDGYTIPFEDSSFDVITMFDTIEHIPHLNDFMQEVKRVLRSDGVLIFGTPNAITNIPWEINSSKISNQMGNYQHCLHTVPFKT